MVYIGTNTLFYKYGTNFNARNPKFLKDIPDASTKLSAVQTSATTTPLAGTMTGKHLEDISKNPAASSKVAKVSSLYTELILTKNLPDEVLRRHNHSLDSEDVFLKAHVKKFKNPLTDIGDGLGEQELNYVEYPKDLNVYLYMRSGHRFNHFLFQGKEQQTFMDK